MWLRAQRANISNITFRELVKSSPKARVILGRGTCLVLCCFYFLLPSLFHSFTLSSNSKQRKASRQRLNIMICKEIHIFCIHTHTHIYIYTHNYALCSIGSKQRSAQPHHLPLSVADRWPTDRLISTLYPPRWRIWCVKKHVCFIVVFIP